MTRWTEVFPDLGASIRFWAETNQVSKECWPLRARHHLWHCYPVRMPARRDEFVQDDEEETRPVKKSAPVNDSTLARGSRRVSPRHFIKAKLAAIAKKNVLRITDSRVADIVAESNRNVIHPADTAMQHLLMLHHHAKAINNTELTTRADDFSQSGASDFSHTEQADSASSHNCQAGTAPEERRKGLFAPVQGQCGAHRCAWSAGPVQQRRHLLDRSWDAWDLALGVGRD
ncbi:uncharacterized protein MYCGRDRAFT_97925 [Zymoseptoria tritici IPO323]|uniref:Uncharacterized protein n=1 Tax=Zymoseptoria tritici (strain CBS 115943 / IPO323) TaxID=336722 RepID=F9XRT1_ZYMTI|nr:uncharacterized protein MYCGRDRAFT_97925 [Zymoseptoria tritici IPO323]EGP81969.1 hypothetical protein MYCGRDRAFT_97925 [Zymoseptoria tritici IPO323]